MAKNRVPKRAGAYEVIAEAACGEVSVALCAASEPRPADSQYTVITYDHATEKARLVDGYADLREATCAFFEWASILNEGDPDEVTADA